MYNKHKYRVKKNNHIVPAMTFMKIFVYMLEFAAYLVGFGSFVRKKHIYIAQTLALKKRVKIMLCPNNSTFRVI